jgi:hypothetical protein
MTVSAGNVVLDSSSSRIRQQRRNAGIRAGLLWVGPAAGKTNEIARGYLAPWTAVTDTTAMRDLNQVKKRQRRAQVSLDEPPAVISVGSARKSPLTRQFATIDAIGGDTKAAVRCDLTVSVVFRGASRGSGGWQHQQWEPQGVVPSYGVVFGCESSRS